MAENRSINDEIAQEKKSMNDGARRLAEDNAKKAFLEAKKHADELRNAAIKDEIDRIMKEAVERYDPKKGTSITKQAIFEDKLKSVMGSEQSSIHDWKSSMMALTSVLSAFVAAVNQDVNELTAPYLVPLKHALKNGVIDMKDTLLNKLRGDPRVDLPTLVHDVKIGKGNKLVVNLRAGEQQLNQQEQLPQGLRTLVALWLNERGYEIDPNNNEGFRSKEGHEPLTAEAFNNLKSNPDNGLNEFLNRASEVQYREELDDSQALTRTMACSF